MSKTTKLSRGGLAGRLRAHRRACSARTDALAPRAPTRTLRALRRAYPARIDRALATRTTRSSGAQTRASGALSAHSCDAKPASPLLYSLCDQSLVYGWAPLCPITEYMCESTPLPVDEAWTAGPTRQGRSCIERPNRSPYR